MASKRRCSPALEIKMSPDDTFRCVDEEAVLLDHTPSGSHLPIRKAPVPPDVASPSTRAQAKVLPGTSGAVSPSKKARRSLKFNDKANADILMDSGSDGDDDDDDDGCQDVLTQHAFYKLAREQEAEEESVNHPEPLEFEGLIAIGQPSVSDKVIDEVLARECVFNLSDQADLEQPTLAQAYEGLDVFSWSKDFSKFTGQEETYLRTPGPTVKSQDPIKIFTKIWDKPIMEKIVAETNKYAFNTIAKLAEVENGIPQYLMEWKETTVEELYRYFAVIMFMTLCYRSRLADYWTTSVLGMPDFRKLMSKNRYLLLCKFIHFVDNDEMDPRMSSYDKKIFKIHPVLDHLNKKFAKLYVPNKHLSLDESLLLWKGRLSWTQCIRSKAARFGVKSYELCEAVTGYQLKSLIYAGKDSNMSEQPIHGFESCTTKVVLELMDGFLDMGHNLVMDNWYNRLPLTRFLKRRKTDVIGTINPRQLHVPDDIKRAIESPMVRGEQVARHCGDISLIAWKDVKLVTAVSTFHDDKKIAARRAGDDISVPKVIAHYNKYMGGVDSKDQKLSMFLMERRRGKKWYIKVFRRLLNTSILNAYIIYTKNPITKIVTHRAFRESLAVGLTTKYVLEPKAPAPKAPAPEAPASSTSENVLSKNARRLLRNADHFVENTEFMPEKKRNNQHRCVRCTAAGRRTMTVLRCTFCRVSLCVGTCWAEYHTLKNLKSPV